MQVVDQNSATQSLGEPVVGGLAVVDLRKSYVTAIGSRLEVLSGLSLSAEPGEAIAIMGASGSGKSTLLQILGGLDDADHGLVEIGGIEVLKLPRSDLEKFRQESVGFIFQFHYLLQDLSVLENVMLPLMISRQQRVEATQRAKQLLEEFGLGDRFESQIGHLSGGEQQRVAVARALVTRPKLLLADEPTGNLDSSIGAEIGRVLVEYAHKHSAIVIIATHSEGLARVCDRVLILERGRLKPL
jgi:lipoprotein-releasing system ATP-binding protein